MQKKPQQFVDNGPVFALTNYRVVRLHLGRMMNKIIAVYLLRQSDKYEFITGHVYHSESTVLIHPKGVMVVVTDPWMSPDKRRCFFTFRADDNPEAAAISWVGTPDIEVRLLERSQRSPKPSC